ncbi:hypothetical protein AKJ50_01980 [candidate division MSBL1 archaeon SCGC-AAA382A13]|uniref:Flavoprotein domain-containing protein n=1 Tax=candidate division MSBL1 archaeon SCGC-AAA382A13 TaxID=1698279 RepID=A0A133VED4_9EURY|nr:hypothetical protein AKJ50_01980 [candidate division MSBL1 archaeon SCGC-AAA382A13]
MKIAWGVTGAGDKIENTIEEMENIGNKKDDLEIHVFVSKAGKEMLDIYRLTDKIKESKYFNSFSVAKSSNKPFLAGALQSGRYKGLLIAPATANTVAKISNGIGDTLLTNSAFMAMKSFIPVHIMPVDLKLGVIKTTLPDGKELKMRVREEDVNNVEKLRKTDGIDIIEEPSNLQEHVNKIIKSSPR